MLSDRLMALIRNPETPTFVLRDAVAEEEEPVASVWLVEGRCGEYSDKHSWTVAAYLDKAQAEGLVERLTKWCKDNGYDDGLPENYWGEAVSVKPPDDPQFSCDGTGTKYGAFEVTLRVEEGS